MSSATANAVPPANPTIVNGVRVYQGVHGAGAINDTGADFALTVSGAMNDSNGRGDSFTDTLLVPAGQNATQVWNTSYPTNDPSGAVVTITISTQITGAASDSASQTITITVP
jgi:hypothetical protein